MGDLIMTTPALKALKETFACHLTVLTSAMAQSITDYIPVIDDVIVGDLPWVRSNTTASGSSLQELAALLRSCRFDAAIIFTVYSQSALPAALLALMAGIPVRLAYSRENPYDLLTHWLPDKEPYSFVQHQVKRDLALVAATGAVTCDDRLLITVQAADKQNVHAKLQQASVDTVKGYLMFHAGVSEEKRKYPLQHWIELGQLAHTIGLPILLTGTAREKELTGTIAAGIGNHATDVAGLFTTGEFIALTAGAAGIVSVNTATIHIAAACETPVVVLYALTNPQHTPWKVCGRVFPYDVPDSRQSRNEVIGYVRNNRMVKQAHLPRPAAIVQALESLLQPEKGNEYIAPDTLIL